MAGGHAKVHVRCPYYRTDNGSQRIVCEGVLADDPVVSWMPSREALRRQITRPRGGGDRVLWERNLDLWRNGETARQEPAHEEDAAPEETPKKQTALLHARLELDGDREAILSHLRLLMPDEGRVTVEW